MLTLKQKIALLMLESFLNIEFKLGEAMTPFLLTELISLLYKEHGVGGGRGAEWT